MNEDIIRMALEAGGIRYTEKDDNGTGMFATFDMVKFGIPMLERFFHMAQAAEREACAKVCEHISKKSVGAGWPHGSVADDCAAAIRTRGQA